MQALGSKVLLEYSHLAARGYPRTDRASRVLCIPCAGKVSNIDRFQVSHFRPVVMEIEIGGRSEKSLGGQESTAVDQECMLSYASSLSFWPLSFLVRLSFFGTGFPSGAADSSQ